MIGYHFSERRTLRTLDSEYSDLTRGQEVLVQAKYSGTLSGWLMTNGEKYKKDCRQANVDDNRWVMLVLADHITQ